MWKKTSLTVAVVAGMIFGLAAQESQADLIIDFTDHVDQIEARYADDGFQSVIDWKDQQSTYIRVTPWVGGSPSAGDVAVFDFMFEQTWNFANADPAEITYGQWDVDGDAIEGDIRAGLIDSTGTVHGETSIMPSALRSLETFTLDQVTETNIEGIRFTLELAGTEASWTKPPQHIAHFEAIGAVPEPTSVVLLGLSSLLMLRRRRGAVA